MEDKKNTKIYNRLFLKVYLNYAFLVLLFAVVLGTIFLNLSERSTINSFRDRLLKQGEAVSKRYTEFIINKEYEKGFPYLEMLKEIGAEEIWTVSNPENKLPEDARIFTIEGEFLSNNSQYTKVLEGAFNNQETYATSYSKIHGCDVITVGVPVTGSKGQVCGAIVINAAVEDQTEILNSTKSLIFVSALLALLVSFVLALIFARQLVRPIARMRTTALALARQEYEVKTGIKRKDEIGDLAATIDSLTDKLLENDKVRKNLEQMRLDFFANVSHELRTPITVVRAYTESLIDGVVTDEATKQRYYEKMLGQCKGMERLVGDLLTLSKMQNPDFKLKMEPVNLVQVFDDIVRAVKAVGEEKKIDICLSYNASVCMMYGDYERLRQMFMIICDNAIKFSHENSVIRITIEKSDKITVKIRDEGIGIAKSDLENIFNKFYKSNLRQNEKGSGLGLSIAKQIAIRHGGTIDVTSTVGVGTEFVFIFDSIKLENFGQ